MSLLDVGKKIIELGAPFLGFTVGGVSGGVFIEAISKIFGANPSDPKDIIDKMASDDYASDKLRQFEKENNDQLQKINLDVMKLTFDHDISVKSMDLTDVESARKMELQSNSWVPEFLTVSLSVTLVTALIFLFVLKIPEQNRIIIVGILLLLGWLFMVCCRFWLGGNIPSLQDLLNMKGK